MEYINSEYRLLLTDYDFLKGKYEALKRQLFIHFKDCRNGQFAGKFTEMEVKLDDSKEKMNTCKEHCLILEN